MIEEEVQLVSSLNLKATGTTKLSTEISAVKININDSILLIEASDTIAHVAELLTEAL